ncbi:unnamed protein product [Paramecium octaurelia]|uniref:EGF-like domain-containing protein n=1 Tax=Paramecium octaurelia TaxID=43137 RepID=A0A8S1WQB5_PAROT|nr:unnamed protein product [Paramecium octaurelia]
MFFHFFKCYFLTILFHQVVGDWRLIDQSFTDASMVNNNWKIRDGCSDSSETSFDYPSCSSNSLKYVRLDDDRRYLYKTFNYKSFQVRVVFDVFYDDADDDDESYLKVSYESNKDSESDQQLYRRDYEEDDLIQNSARICRSSWGKFEFYTIVSTIASSNTNKFTIKFCSRPRSDSMEVGIRNLLIYINSCHPTCLTCDGPTETDCLSCFNSQSQQGGKCICIPDQQFSETYIGCRQECSRDFSIARYDKICVNDNRIKSKYTLFEDDTIPQSTQRYQPLTFEGDEFNPRYTELVIENCNGISFIGKLQFNEGMLYKMSLEDAVKFVRIRISFYLFNFQTTSNIKLIHNGQIQSSITKDSSSFQVENLLIIFEKSENCAGDYTLLRIETIFQITNPNPTLLIKGSLQYKSEAWGFRNITVDTGFCQEKCLVCSDFSTCTLCDSTYKLYKNKCIEACPIHSTNCIDYEDIIPYSRYLAKGFYNLNMTLDEIKEFYDFRTDPSFSQSTKQDFSVLSNKIVLGGLLVWNDGSYIKTWTIQKPHYAATIYFNLTYGDAYTGSFSYKIGPSSSSTWSASYSNPGGGSNLIGRTGLESSRFFNVSLTNFYTNNLYVEFKCDVSATNITKEFCAISEYFIVIHYCPPFCTSCTSLNVCSNAGYTGPNCGSTYYLDFNSSTEIYSCKQCNQSGCNTCTSSEQCTQCISNRFYLSNGICLCYPFTVLQGNNCVQCNKYCENCYGDTQYTCLTCVRDYNRGIQRNQCLCLPGYYDDGINLPCLPICGDQIVVEEEDCDDGNNNPFDGCHNCQFACNFACDICLNGKCYQCKSGYEVHNNDCRSICEGNTLALLQQCFEQQRNCVNCLYECSPNCIDCSFGKCVKCDEERGWYSQIDGTCNSICGDGIVISLTEMCDDGNTNPSDGCNQCQYSCDKYCETCVNSLCIFCQSGYQQIENHCIPLCQDGLLVFPEQCEDGNMAPYDGCFNCQFQCSIHCIDCKFGICQQCNEQRGWYLQQNGSCKSICGDNILVLEDEDCDDSNPNSLCNQCQITCDINCLQCYKGVCISCLLGYKWDYSIQECVKVCGDSALFNIEKVCEDGNNLLDDGCYLCQLSCQDSCTLCTATGCLECNTIGWKLDELQNKCETICGDGITVQYYEECDDLKDQNCFQCKYNCQDSCLLCHHGDCLQCKDGWQIHLDKRCYSFKGDHQVVGDEECDDNNSVMYDGCYLSQYQCQKQCKDCRFGICIKCEDGYQNLDGRCLEILNLGFIQGNEQCDEKNLIAEDVCFNGQLNCSEGCEHSYQDLCLQCNPYSHQLNTFNHLCLSFCGDGYLSHFEQCDDANNIPYDGCYECKFQCNYYCQTCYNGVCLQCSIGYYLDQSKNVCYSICGDGILAHDEQCDNENLVPDELCVNCKLLCQQQCTACIEGQCFECISQGWQLDVINRNCQPICGDLLVLGNEQCDDGNDVSDDGCIDCFFQCQQQCTLCENGECRECNIEGWKLSINKCITICGDQLVLGKEECDDGNLIPHDGCFECQFQCQEQCTDCVKGNCQACNKSGWLLSQNNLCSTYCGDGIAVNPYEQCDDGNDIPYDGCYKCEFQCEQLCTICEFGICYECNQLGWIIKNNKCTPYCGDGLIVGNEQCDDMNSNQNDGCFECRFMCDQYCVDCWEGVCKECPEGMYLLDQICQSICGDGFNFQKTEKCDDGNKGNGDGCNSQCKIEKDWICNTNQYSFSICYFEKQPDFSMIVLTPYPHEYCDIQVSFTQQVKYSQHVKQNLSEHIQASILNHQNDMYNIQMTQETEISHDQVTDLVLIFRVNFLYPIESPVFQIQFSNDPIISELNQTLTQSQKSIKLQTPIVLSSQEVLIAQQASSFNEAIIISLASLSSICLLTGQSEIFWNLMDQLQYLSYIKYINIGFSPNLDIFFDVFQLITVSPLMAALGFQKIFDYLDGSSKYVVETSNKFKKDNINAYFLTNFQSFLFCLITAYLSYSAAQLIYGLFNKMLFKKIVNWRFSILKLLINSRRQLQQKISEFYYNSLLRLMLSNSYDISFASAIQMAYQPLEKNNVLMLNYYLSYLFYIGIHGTIIYFINISSSFSKQNSIRNKQKYQAMFDGINESYNIWTFQYNSIQLIKKLIFISLIVFLQENGFIQAIGISFIQTLFLIHTILNKPLSNQFEYFKILITEALIILNSISFLFYLYQVELGLKSESIINIGWFHIFTFSLILAATFILDLIQQIKKLIKVIGVGEKKQEQQLEPIFY